jgi:hypothetical protein
MIKDDRVCMEEAPRTVKGEETEPAKVDVILKPFLNTDFLLLHWPFTTGVTLSSHLLL